MSQNEVIARFNKVSFEYGYNKPILQEADFSIRRGAKITLMGQNGAGKSTIFQLITKTLQPESGDADMTQQKLRSVAAGFLIDEHLLHMKIGKLSEGQKGLVIFARLVIQKPGLLILDEPTNHINFRHIPIIASALNKYTGAMILVSHIPEFVQQIKIDKILDLEKV